MPQSATPPNSRNSIDLNADAGESFGPWPMGNDTALFPALSSVNLACGLHAGDPLTMDRAVALALEHGLGIGAHPGYPDLVGFGRRDLAMTAEELRTSVLYQLGALDAFVRTRGGRLGHVKAHGALYLTMMREQATADAVVAAVRAFAADLPLVVLGGPGGSLMRAACESAGQPFLLEAFPDRAYLANGQLSPRSLPGSLILDPDTVAARAVAMATGRPIAAIDGGSTGVEADTLCIHGDNEPAPRIAAAVRRALEENGVEVRAPR